MTTPTPRPGVLAIEPYVGGKSGLPGQAKTTRGLRDAAALEDVLTRHGATRDDVISGLATEGIGKALREMRDLARFHLMEAQKRMAGLPKGILPAFLSIEMVPGYLARMEKPDYDPFRTQVAIPQWLRPWTLWRAARRFKSRC